MKKLSQFYTWKHIFLFNTCSYSSFIYTIYLRQCKNPKYSSRLGWISIWTLEMSFPAPKTVYIMCHTHMKFWPENGFFQNGGHLGFLMASIVAEPSVRFWKKLYFWNCLVILIMKQSFIFIFSENLNASFLGSKCLQLTP